MADALDQKTLDLFNKISEKRAAVESARSTHPILTNLSFSYDEPKRGSFNLRTMTVQELIAAAAFLLSRKGHHGEAVAKLGVKDAGPFTWGGFSVDAWLTDIKNMVAKLQLAAQERDLADLENRLNAIVSPELRRTLEIEALSKILD